MFSCISNLDGHAGTYHGNGRYGHGHSTFKSTVATSGFGHSTFCTKLHCFSLVIRYTAEIFFKNKCHHTWHSDLTKPNFGRGSASDSAGGGLDLLVSWNGGFPLPISYPLMLNVHCFQTCSWACGNSTFQSMPPPLLLHLLMNIKMTSLIQS